MDDREARSSFALAEYIEVIVTLLGDFWMEFIESSRQGSIGGSGVGCNIGGLSGRG